MCKVKSPNFRFDVGPTANNVPRRSCRRSKPPCRPRRRVRSPPRRLGPERRAAAVDLFQFAQLFALRAGHCHDALVDGGGPALAGQVCGVAFGPALGLLGFVAPRPTVAGQAADEQGGVEAMIFPARRLARRPSSSRRRASALAGVFPLHGEIRAGLRRIGEGLVRRAGDSNRADEQQQRQRTNQTDRHDGTSCRERTGRENLGRPTTDIVIAGALDDKRPARRSAARFLGDALCDMRAAGRAIAWRLPQGPSSPRNRDGSRQAARGDRAPHCLPTAEQAGSGRIANRGGWQAVARDTVAAHAGAARPDETAPPLRRIAAARSHRRRRGAG